MIGRLQVHSIEMDFRWPIIVLMFTSYRIFFRAQQQQQKREAKRLQNYVHNLCAWLTATISSFFFASRTM